MCVLKGTESVLRCVLQCVLQRVLKGAGSMLQCVLQRVLQCELQCVLKGAGRVYALHVRGVCVLQCVEVRCSA